MSNLLPTINYSEFKKLNPEQLKQLKTCEVYFNLAYMFTFVNPQTPYIRTQVEYLGQTGNAIGGKDLKEVLNAK